MEIPLEVTPEIPAGGCQVDLAFSGRFGGREITPAVVPLIQTGAMLAENVGREPEWRSPARWRANSSGEMEISFDEKEQALKLKTVFAPGTDRWIYPEFILKPRESFRRARGVAFEIKTVPSMPKEAVFMAVMGREKEHGRAVFIRFPMPSAEWEERIISFDEFVPNPENIEMIRLGVNPKSDRQSYWVRNLRVFYR